MKKNKPTKKYITCHCISIAQAEESVPTKMASTVAANRDLLNLIDCHTVGQVFKSDDLQFVTKSKEDPVWNIWSVQVFCNVYKTSH